MFATSIKQIGLNRFMLCFSSTSVRRPFFRPPPLLFVSPHGLMYDVYLDVATFVDNEGNVSAQPGCPQKVVFEQPPEVSCWR